MSNHSDPAQSESPAATYEIRGPVAVITLNRPHVLNAVNDRLSTAAGNALEEAAKDPGIRAIVITGAGSSFCAGADLKELAVGKRLDAFDHPEWGFAGIARHWVEKPTIAAVSGFAMGGGTELILACDLAVADETAKLGLPEVHRGIFAAAGGVIRLQSQVPLKLALEIVLVGQPMSGIRAAELGLVNRVTPEGGALAEALRLAETIATAAPLAVQTTKRLMYAAGGLSSDSEDRLWQMNSQEARLVMRSQDAQEGARAFAEKRQPRWRGR